MTDRRHGSAAAIGRFAFALHATSVRATMANRGTFLLQAGLMLINNAIFFTFWVALLTRVSRIRGYTLGDVAVLYGSVAIAIGMSVVFAGGILDLARFVHDGELDSWLAQPKPTLLYAIGSRSRASGIGDIVSGIIMIALSGKVGLSAMPIVAFAVLAGAIIAIASGILFGCAAFWVGRMETAIRQLFETLITFALYPESLFGGAIRVILFTVIPAGFVGYVPARLIRAPSWASALELLAAAIVYVSLAMWVFKRGLRSYRSGSQFVMVG